MFLFFTKDDRIQQEDFREKGEKDDIKYIRF